jgi:hypothetical protein
MDGMTSTARKSLMTAGLISFSIWRSLSFDKSIAGPSLDLVFDDE